MTGHLPPAFAGLLTELEAGLTILPDKPDESAEGTLRALWFKAAGQPLGLRQARALDLPLLDDEASVELEGLVRRRLAGAPLAHLTGRQDFMDLVLLATPDALIPRRETELLARHAIRKIGERKGAPTLVIDVCCGAGNVALAVAHHEPAAVVFGSDLDPGATELARANAQFTGHLDVEFRTGDLLDPFQEPRFLGQVDILTCNPPYISSPRVDEMETEIREHEPRAAFDGGALGVTILRRLVRESPSWLRPGGWLICEVGQGQGETMARLLGRSSSFETVETLEDEQGHVRVLAAQRAT
jgi:release factor glutamine methyltransferase